MKQVEGMLILESTRHPDRGATCTAVKEELYIYLLGHEEPHAEGNSEEVTLDRHPGKAI